MIIRPHRPVHRSIQALQSFGTPNPVLRLSPQQSLKRLLPQLTVAFIMTSKTAKISKTIARQKEKSVTPLFASSSLPPLRPTRPPPTQLTLSCRIAEGSYYEAHQQLRVISARYVKASDWASALDVLQGGAIALLQAGHGGSGGDLAGRVVEVLEKRDEEEGNEGKGVGREDRGMLLAILRAFPTEEPTRKKYVQQMIAWSAKAGDVEVGDPEMHHAVGVLYAEGKGIPAYMVYRLCLTTLSDNFL